MSIDFLYNVSPITFGVAALVLGPALGLASFLSLFFDRLEFRTHAYMMSGITASFVAGCTVVTGLVPWLIFTVTTLAVLSHVETLRKLLLDAEAGTLVRLWYVAIACVGVGCICSAGLLWFLTDAWALSIAICWIVTFAVIIFSAIRLMRRSRPRR